ncbi:MAG: hypothetical protein LIO46_06720 [Clostridiales bacterium]|nr:hypothetical protein [Clostridiales bacterium]
MKKTQDVLMTVLLLSAGSLLVVCSVRARAGVTESLELCKNVLIPSMFPFLFLSNFIPSSNAGYVIRQACGKWVNKLFRLPGCCAAAILLGMVSGYPTGAVMTSRMLERGDIDRATARRLLKFCVNGGLPFLVTAVGSIMYQSVRVGIILFSASTAAALIIGFGERLLHPKPTSDKPPETLSLSYSEALVDSVQRASSSMLSICAYVLLFGAVAGMLRSDSPLWSYLAPLLEITTGTTAAKGITLPVLCGFLAFGGLCIHCQLAPILIQAKMRYLEFLAYRLLHAGLSILLCYGLFLLFPVPAAVFTNTGAVTPQLVSVSTTASVLLVVMSVVLVLDIDSKKKIC